jgi:RNA polymerase sigma factor (sigma-70 family)
MEAGCRSELEGLGVEAVKNLKNFTPQGLPGIPEGMPVFPHRKKGFSEKEQLQELKAAKPLLRHWVRHFTRNGLLEYEEAMQEAMLGFLKAMQRYDPEKICSLRSYAHFWIVDGLQAASNRNLLLHVPLGVTKAILADYRAEQLANAEGSKPLSRKCEHSAASKQAAVRALHGTYAAKPFGNADTSPIEHQYLDAELSRTMADGSDQICCQVDFKQVIAYLGRLNVLQQRVLCLRFLHGMTLDEIGQCLGISREGVRQTQERGLASLRKRLGVVPGEGFAPPRKRVVSRQRDS